MKVFINPGHALNGVPDPGACNYNLGIRESDIAASVGVKVQYYLEQAGCEVYLLQSDNLAGESPEYPNVVRAANNWGADVFVSIHCNAASAAARGIETLVYGLGGSAEKLAQCIQDQVVNTLQAIDPNIPDRGLKERSGLAVLKYTDMPAILVEQAFISNENDAKLLMDNQDDIAKAIARGVTDYNI